MDKIVKLLKDVRDRYDWSQAELARQLGVGQQTVSGWERGTSRPRHADRAKIARFLGRDLDAIDGDGDRPLPIPRPLVPRLPLDDLAPDRFEDFVVDLASALPPRKPATKWGGQGDKQGGIDVCVRDDDGSLLETFQCKREKQFGAAKVRKAILEVTHDASAHHIVLSRTASPAARTEAARHPRWSIWDADDVTRKLRMEAPRHLAITIVDTYFPGMRESLLGERQPSPWLSPEDFFRPIGGDRIYSQDWDMVGRTEELRRVVQFFEGDGRIGAIVGRGGIGKSRLAKEGCARLSPEWTVLCLGKTDGVLPEQFEQLPRAGKLLVVVDDAHERHDLASLVVGVARSCPSAKLLFTARPYGIRDMEAQLRMATVHWREIESWPLGDLTFQAGLELVRQILGEDAYPSLANSLANIGRDCPLIAVVGASLAKQGLLTSAAIEKSGDVRKEILELYLAKVVGNAPSEMRADARSVLEVVSILQPLHIKDDGFQECALKVTGLELQALLRALGYLESSGSVLRRGDTYRVVPDLFGDVVLSSACFDSALDMDNGFIARVCEGLSGDPLQHLFVNVCRIDWQVRGGAEETGSLAEALWDSVLREFHDADAVKRLGLLKLVEKVAYYQPGKALTGVRAAIDATRGDDENQEPVSYGVITGRHVRQALAPILKLVAYNPSFTPQALDLLWGLANDDQRPTNPLPDHPRRVLLDLAELEPAKPIEFSQMVLDACERWLGDEVGDFSPFDVMVRLLAASGHETRAEGHSLVFSSFPIDAATVRDIRQRVIQVALREVASGNLRRAVRAIEAIGSGLHYPELPGGLITDDVIGEEWTQMLVGEIGQLQAIAADPAADPVISIAVRKALRWHASFSPTRTRSAAHEALAAMPDTEVSSVSLALYDSWGHLTGDKEDDYELSRAAQTEALDALTERLLGTYDVPGLAALLENRLRKQAEAFGSDGDPIQFLMALTRRSRDLAEAICYWVAANPSSPLVAGLGVSFEALMQTPDKAGQALANLAATADPALLAMCIRIISWDWGGIGRTVPGSNELLRNGASHDSARARWAVIDSLGRVAKSDRSLAHDLLARVCRPGSLDLAKELFAVFGDRGPFKWHEVSPQVQEAYWQLLAGCKSVDDYRVADFINVVAESDPGRTLELMLSRVDEFEKSGNNVLEWRPVPHNRFVPSWRQGADRAGSLRKIRDWMATRPESWARRTYGPDLFNMFANGFDDVAKAVVTEAFADPRPGMFWTLCALLHNMPERTVWEDLEFVSAVLRMASSLGADQGDCALSAVFASAVRGSRSGAPGEPFHRDVHQRDTARAVALRLSAGSPEHKLYVWLEKSARDSIEAKADTDGLLLDHRDWV